MIIHVLGGWSVEHDGAPVEVTGERQRGLLFRLALDPGTVVGYRALAEDLWPDDLPENPKASLQSLVARLRPQLPAGVLASAPGGYRLEVRRDEVDAIRFQDAVAAAVGAAPGRAAGLASAKLVKDATLKVYPGAPHGITDTHKDQLNADLLAFAKS